MGKGFNRNNKVAYSLVLCVELKGIHPEENDTV
jgi:hypothetical protein